MKYEVNHLNVLIQQLITPYVFIFCTPLKKKQNNYFTTFRTNGELNLGLSVLGFKIHALHQQTQHKGMRKKLFALHS